MLDWKEIKGVKKGLNYRGQKAYGVDLPELNEEVLFCRPNYMDKTKDIYFSGYVCESDSIPQIVNSILGGVEFISEGVKWARFNKPETLNNKRFGIAYLDRQGKGFLKSIPYIVEVKENEIKQTVNNLKQEGYTKITPFSCISPFTYDYNWDYIETHRISNAIS